jgi:hypothetical protein
MKYLLLVALVFSSLGLFAGDFDHFHAQYAPQEKALEETGIRFQCVFFDLYRPGEVACTFDTEYYVDHVVDLRDRGLLDTVEQEQAFYQLMIDRLKDLEAPLNIRYYEISADYDQIEETEWLLGYRVQCRFVREMLESYLE